MIKKQINKELKIGFVGCGNMATAIIKGLIDSGFPAGSIMVSNRGIDKLEQIAKQTQVLTTQNNIKCVNYSDIVVFAVKPQVLTIICSELSECNLSQRLIISVAAGVSTKKIAEYLNNKTAIVRAMPNTPSVVNQGATGLFANQKTSVVQKEQAEAIFGSLGYTDWVEKESLIDVVTAIAGSSPAYVFMFIQAMAEQAIAEGLSPESARSFATQAVIGAGKLAIQSDSTSLEDLRKAVTSPGGTTAAAITSFEHNEFSNIIKQAVSAAVKRGKELGEQA